MTSYHHGVRVIEISERPQPVHTLSTAVIGFVATADDADANVFPENTAVLITNPLKGLASAGTTGTLAHTLKAISDQTKAVCVVVRVPEGLTVEETRANVIGGEANGQYSGLQALLTAQSQLGIKPRILGCPGLDTAAVTAAMVALAQRLRAFVYAGCGTATTMTEAIAYRNTFAARELMLLWPDFLDASGFTLYATARAMGLRAKIDQQVGWHKTLSNVAVNGVLGISADVYWNPSDESCDANLLNQSAITTLVASKTGQRFWGNRTCSDDPRFVFESYARTGQIIAEMIAESQARAIDKPMHASVSTDIINGINANFSAMAAAGLIIGGNAWLDTSINTPDALKFGRLTIDYNYTPVPPLEDLTFRQQSNGRVTLGSASTPEPSIPIYALTWSANPVTWSGTLLTHSE